MSVISGKAFLCTALLVGVPLFLIGYEADASAAPVRPAQCNVHAEIPITILERHLTFTGTFSCQYAKPGSVRATVQAIRGNRVWASIPVAASPIQVPIKCRRGGPYLKYRTRVLVYATDRSGGKRRAFVKTGIPIHWRCLA